jgi:hypothetical protein
MIMSNQSAETGKGERRGLVGFLKKFNKISAAVFLSAGVIFESGTLLALGAIDVGQSYLLGRYEKWRDKRKAGKNIGRVAMSGT